MEADWATSDSLIQTELEETDYGPGTGNLTHNNQWQRTV
jgi:hypothetical protein